jgi:nitrite reductase/ring-hydroxylating ferredoxin subunit/uncharacterized membrane protein
VTARCRSLEKRSPRCRCGGMAARPDRAGPEQCCIRAKERSSLAAPARPKRYGVLFETELAPVPSWLLLEWECATVESLPRRRNGTASLTSWESNEGAPADGVRTLGWVGRHEERGMPVTFAGQFALSQRWAGRLAERLQPLITRAVGVPAVRNALDGVWLGAPLHPVLTDVPVGSWTAALVLDAAAALTGDEALSGAADRTLAVGTVAALPTAAAGLNDLRDLVGQSRQVAMVHGLLNVVGLSFSTASLVARATGRRGLGRGFSATGFLISSSAAHLGGQLSFGLGIRVNRTVGQPIPESFVPVLDAVELDDEELREVTVDGVPMLIARSRSGEICALANTCTHLGGPLAEGSRDGDTVACPWHGSRFDLRTGAVVEGPAVFAEPHLNARVREGKIEVGRPGVGAGELPELSTFGPAPGVD